MCSVHIVLRCLSIYMSATSKVNHLICKYRFCFIRPIMMAKKIVILVIFLSIVISVFVLIITFCLLPTTNDLVLTLPDGKLQGATYLSPNNITYYGFRGIPYATPPLGDLRFEAPQPVQPWDDIKDASSDGKSCISLSYLENPDDESEDCLFLNVYTPTLESGKKLPVMAWIYGGKFAMGSASKSVYGPDLLVEEDVIMVSLNYRIGPFGFISTADSSLRGNYGLKDQNLALKWIYNNIEYFGGDPNNITIFGQSAGGISVGLHMLSKQSAGLFNGAILESGSALMPSAIDKDPKTTAFMIGDAISGGNYGNDTTELKKFLQAQSVADIITAYNSLSDNVTYLFLIIKRQVWPVVEEKSDGAFLDESPYEVLSTGQYNKVPIIIGICSEEGYATFQNQEYANELAALYDTVTSKVIPSDLFPNASEKTTVVKEIKAIYLKNGETFVSNLLGAVELFSDDEFARAIMKYAQLTSSEIPVYFYQFAYYGRTSLEPFIDGAEKASHAAELPFLFYQSGLSDSTDSEDLLTQNRMVKLWTNFAKHLNPTPTESELFDNIIWPQLNAINFTYLNINGTLEIRKNLKQNARTKWDNIYNAYGKKPFITF